MQATLCYAALNENLLFYISRFNLDLSADYYNKICVISIIFFDTLLPSQVAPHILVVYLKSNTNNNSLGTHYNLILLW